MLIGRIRLAGLAALVAGSMLLAPATTHATYTYVSTATPASAVFGGTTITLGGVSSATPLSGTGIINALKVGFQTATVPPATDTGVFTFTNSLVITNTAGSVTLTPQDMITLLRADTGGEISTGTLTGGVLSATLGGFRYTILSLQYSGPTINNSGAGVGNISYILQEAAVPEPASLASLAVGLVTLGGFAVRRRRQASV